MPRQDRQETVTDTPARLPMPFDTTVAHQSRVYDYWLGGPHGITAYLDEDTDGPQAIVRRLLDAVPPGSWLGIAHPARDVLPEVVTMARNLSQRSVTPTTLRTHAEISRFFDGLELLPPGVLHRWEPGDAAPQTGRQVPAYCGLVRKP